MYYRIGTPVDGALDLQIEPALQKGQVRKENSSLVISYASLTGEAPRRGHTRDLHIGLEIRVTPSGDGLSFMTGAF
jgi:hypothetical protein